MRFLTTDPGLFRNGGTSFHAAARPADKSVPPQMDRRHLQLERKDGESAQTRGRERKRHLSRYGTCPGEYITFSSPGDGSNPGCSLQSFFSSKRRYLPVGLSIRAHRALTHTFDLTISVPLLEPRVPWHGRVFPKIRPTKMEPH